MLPLSGAISLAELSETLSSTLEELQLPRIIELRVVAFMHGGTPYPFASALFPIEHVEKADVLEAGELRLLSLTIPVSSLDSTERLTAFLQSWRNLLVTNHRPCTFFDPIPVSRQYKGYSGRSVPAWILSFVERADDSSISPSSQPVATYQREFFASSYADAAAQWLRDEQLQHHTSPRRGIEFVVPDRRAFISDIGVNANRVVVHVDGFSSRVLYCGARFMSPTGHPTRARAEVRAGVATLDVAEGSTAFDVYLIGDDDFPYDRSGGPTRRATSERFDNSPRETEYDEPGTEPSEMVSQSFPAFAELVATRLEAVAPHLAPSYRQVCLDLTDANRQSYRGTVAELREVVRGLIDHLAPDADVVAEKGFQFEDMLQKPSHRQKIRFITRSRRGKQVLLDTEARLDEAFASLGRSFYGRASQATHRGLEYPEALHLKRYGDALIGELLEVVGP